MFHPKGKTLQLYFHKASTVKLAMQSFQVAAGLIWPLSSLPSASVSV